MPLFSYHVDMRKVVLFLCAAFLQAQEPDKTLTFEVASIKPFVPPSGNRAVFMFDRGGRGGPGSSDPGRIHYAVISLKNLIMQAYDMKNYQITGPEWLDTERFDIQATMPPETTKEQLKIMLQNLLAERFKMTLHRDTKELPMYSIVVAKNGPKMKESVIAAVPEGSKEPKPPPPPPPGGRGPLKMGPDGFPVIPGMEGRPGMFIMMMNGRARMMAHQQTMQDLAEHLTNDLNRPVTDATGLKAKYDFTLTYLPEGNNTVMMIPPPGGRGPSEAADQEPPQTVFAALQSDLGLKLEAKKGAVPILIIDHMEKVPTEN